MNQLLKNSTSAAGAFLVRQLREPFVVGLIVVGVGTSAHSSPTEAAIQALRPQEQTTSGVSIELRNSAPSSIAELRRLTGFTWEQLARLFNVSRRSVHFWASGNKMTSANEEHLERVLAVLRVADRGSASANRTLLLAPQSDGVMPFEELANGRYDAVASLLGRGSPRIATKVSALSPATKAARAPRPPEELVGASHERVHQELGKARPGKSVRTESDG
jgi:DNA-binding transcriptional regulator YiaG